MISAVSHFFPAGIGKSPPYVQGRAEPLLQPAIFKPTATLAVNQSSSIIRSTFADKLPITFSLSPADFSDVFGKSGIADFISALLPKTVSLAYAQSNLLTASKLSLSV
jgi:hypothetical protein